MTQQWLDRFQNLFMQNVASQPYASQPESVRCNSQFGRDWFNKQKHQDRPKRHENWNMMQHGINWSHMYRLNKPLAQLLKPRSSFRRSFSDQFHASNSFFLNESSRYHLVTVRHKIKHIVRSNHHAESTSTITVSMQYVHPHWDSEIQSSCLCGQASKGLDPEYLSGLLPSEPARNIQGIMIMLLHMYNQHTETSNITWSIP